MPSRARIVPRMYQGLGRTVPGATYGFHNPQQDDLRGAQALEGDYRDALVQEHHAADERYRQMHAELELAKLRRELAHDEAKTQRRIKYEAMMEKAVPELYAIDPADPQAVQKRAQFAQRWPQLFHKENDVPGITSEFEQHTRLSGEAERQRNAVQAKKEAAEQRAADIKERMEQRERDKQEAEDRRKKDVQERESQRKQDLRENHLGYARGKYDTAEEESTILGKRITENQGYIDAIKGQLKPNEQPSVDQQKQLDLLVKSQDQLKAEKARHDSKMKGLVAQFPELDPAYVPKEKSETATASGTGSPAAIDTAQPDVSAIQGTTPLARGTATPSGEMDLSGSTNGTATPPPEAGDAVVPDTGGEDSVANLSRATPPPAAAPVAVPLPTGEDAVPNLAAVAPAAVAPVAAVPPPPAAAVPPVAEPHPYEGMRVKQKSTGKYGTFKNGQFISEEEEQNQDQPTPE